MRCARLPTVGRACGRLAADRAHRRPSPRALLGADEQGISISTGVDGCDAVASAAAASPAAPARRARLRVADNGTGIAAAARARVFDAFITDGAALWREVRARHPMLAGRLRFVSGDTLSPDAAEFFRSSGCVGLEKPFTRADLLLKVAAPLGSGGPGADGGSRSA